MTENRPYTFQLATFLLDADGNAEHTANVRETAARNGVDLGQLDRAAAFIRHLTADGEDVDEFVRREYLIDACLHGYLPPDTSPTDPTLTTWALAQFAEDYYRRAQENR
ncbi:hypothetical protein [Mycolicibacterium sp. 120270]|uniref:hypothetical protein n=1 Tax=Mycolicibacterium sp. 120270 TaxID=3090600 RepID=UPI00299E36B2|nr:hypothetical protein [Mycolicibacterium sp. 120270]MDX1886836.1 hypothetical protein [Mycolicibacterium sp. 120270]